MENQIEIETIFVKDTVATKIGIKKVLLFRQDGMTYILMPCYVKLNKLRAEDFFTKVSQQQQHG